MFRLLGTTQKPIEGCSHPIPHKEMIMEISVAASLTLWTCGVKQPEGVTSASGEIAFISGLNPDLLSTEALLLHQLQPN